MKKLYFAYVNPSKFSGQAAATFLIIESLKRRGYDCELIKMHPLRRSINNVFIKYIDFTLNNLKVLPGVFKLMFEKKPTLHLTLGQSVSSFLRIFVWLYPVYLIKKDLRIYTSLNGSVFMKWSGDEFKCKFFLLFLKMSKATTVLGHKQKAKLKSLGIDERKIKIVPNASELNPITDEQLDKKHQEPEEYKVLHLSSLIESKGFPEFVETASLAAQNGSSDKIEFTLCGPVLLTAYCSKFEKISDATNWIETKVEQINTLNKNVKITWIKGARGKEKEDLFNDAHIFVLPTNYPVEAQPLVLLEAMAAGCAIISTRVGEIEFILNHENSVLIDDTRPENIKGEISLLLHNSDKRLSLARNGLNDYNNKFSIIKYADKWEEIFNAS